MLDNFINTDFKRSRFQENISEFFNWRKVIRWSLWQFVNQPNKAKLVFSKRQIWVQYSKKELLFFHWINSVPKGQTHTRQISSFKGNKQQPLWAKYGGMEKKLAACDEKNWTFLTPNHKNCHLSKYEMLMPQAWNKKNYKLGRGIQ